MYTSLSMSEMDSEMGGSGSGPERRKKRPVRYEPYSSKVERNEDKSGWCKDRNTPSLCSSSYASGDSDHNKAIKVSPGTDVKELAGRIAQLVRHGERPFLTSTGAKACNQAVKAIAIARKYLSDNDIGIAIRPSVRDGQRCVVGLQVRRCRMRKTFKHKVEMAISSKSIPSTIAGALAARVREGVSACLTGIGVDAIAIGILAISTTRNFLEEDMMDIKACPEFIHVQKEGETLTAIRINILVEDV